MRLLNKQRTPPRGRSNNVPTHLNLVYNRCSRVEKKKKTVLQVQWYFINRLCLFFFFLRPAMHCSPRARRGRSSNVTAIQWCTWIIIIRPPSLNVSIPLFLTISWNARNLLSLSFDTETDGSGRRRLRHSLHNRHENNITSLSSPSRVGCQLHTGPYTF